MLSIAIERVDGVVGVGGAFPSDLLGADCCWGCGGTTCGGDKDVFAASSPVGSLSSPKISSTSRSQLAFKTSMGGSKSPGFPPRRASAAVIFLSPRLWG
jgi:hypothetical protein